MAFSRLEGASPTHAAQVEEHHRPDGQDHGAHEEDARVGAQPHTVSRAELCRHRPPLTPAALPPPPSLLLARCASSSCCPSSRSRSSACAWVATPWASRWPWSTTRAPPRPSAARCCPSWTSPAYNRYTFYPDQRNQDVSLVLHQDFFLSSSQRRRLFVTIF